MGSFSLKAMRVKRHEGNKTYIWPDWTLRWFEHEAVKNWIRLRDRTLISVLERAGNGTDEKRNFYEITFDCGSHFQTRSQFHFWSWYDSWVIYVTQTRFISTWIHPTADSAVLSQYFGQLFFWSRNVFDMAVGTKKGSLQHPIFNKGLMFCNYVIRNVIGSKHLLFKLT